MKYTITVLCASLLLALFLVTKLLGGKSLNRIKARTVGHGQHGSARWATRREIKSYYTMIPYEPQKWRTQQEFRPTKPGFVLGSFQHGRHGKKITAWVDTGDSHAMMIASPGGGKTAYFLYPNIEYAMACGISFVTLDTKGDLYRNMATIGEKYYGHHTVVYDFRKPMESDTYNLMSLVNKYMLLWQRLMRIVHRMVFVSMRIHTCMMMLLIRVWVIILLVKDAGFVKTLL
mgnify:CR=1 FL=1